MQNGLMLIICPQQSHRSVRLGVQRPGEAPVRTAHTRKWEHHFTWVGRLQVLVVSDGCTGLVKILMDVRACRFP